MDNIIQFNEKRKNVQLENLLHRVLKKSVRPQDYYEIAAILESFGWNDERVANVFGVEDIFELAIQLWTMSHEEMHAETYVKEEKIPLRKRVITVLQSFIRGLIFALPMAISVAAMLTLRLSLWSYFSFDVDLATSIAIGTILSFITVGGFTQAIARRGFFYLSQGFYSIAKRTTFYLVRIGYIASFVVGVCYLLLNFFYRNFTYGMIFITVLYFIFLCSNWLSITIMYILRKEFHFAALIAIGILIVAVLFYIFGLNIILSQVIALLLLSIANLFLVVHFFHVAEKKEDRGIAPPLPKRSVMLYTLIPYFLYGLQYFTYIFLDRILSWSRNNTFSMPYMIWFRGDYELGLDFALLSLLIPMGLSEIIVTNLMKKMEITQQNAHIHEVESAKRQYTSAYIKSILLMAVGTIISALLVILIVWFLQSGGFGGNVSKIYHFSSVTYFVFYAALLGYALVSISLSNMVILFSLSQPDLANKAISIALLVNFLVGFALSRWIDYYWAIAGLVVGSIVFLIASTICVLKVIKNLDYYIYASL